MPMTDNDMDEAIKLAISDANRIIKSKTAPGGLAIDVGHVVEAFLAGLFVQIVIRLLSSGTTFIIKKVSTRAEVDSLKKQAVELVIREVSISHNLAVPPLAKLEQDVDALMLERGFAKNVSEEVSASIVTAARELLKKAQQN